MKKIILLLVCSMVLGSCQRSDGQPEQHLGELFRIALEATLEKNKDSFHSIHEIAVFPNASLKRLSNDQTEALLAELGHAYAAKAYIMPDDYRLRQNKMVLTVSIQDMRPDRVKLRTSKIMRNAMEMTVTLTYKEGAWRLACISDVAIGK